MIPNRLHYRQELTTSVEKAWLFFSDPQNLRRITPPWLDFMVTSDLPAHMYQGMIITYTIRPLAGVRMNWVTEITHVHEPLFFVDEQRFGPYRFWHHQHRFEAVAGGVVVDDLVHYALPFGPLGRLIDRWHVRARLEEIFRYRRRVLREIFGEPA